MYSDVHLFMCNEVGITDSNTIRLIGAMAERKAETVQSWQKFRNESIKSLRNKYYREVYEFLRKYDSEPKGE